jgi:hypothetical protein
MTELAEEVKTNKQRVKTLLAKSKTYTAEAEAIDKIIFRMDLFPLHLLLLRSP